MEKTVETKQEPVYNRTEAEQRLARYATLKAEHALHTENLNIQIKELQTNVSDVLEGLNAKMEAEKQYLETFCEKNGSEKSVFDSLGEFGYRKSPLSLGFKKGFKDDDVIELFVTNLENKYADKAIKTTQKVDKNQLKKLLDLEVISIDTLDKCGMVVKNDEYKFFVKPYDVQS